MTINARGIGGAVLLIVASALARATEDPPPDLIRKVAEIESRNEKARANYAYRQSVKVEEFDGRGMIAGFYSENREVVFLEGGKRSEQFSGKVANQLKRLVLTDEDFDDIRHVQPLLVTTEELVKYRVRFRGEEDIGGKPCWVLEFQPRQILDGMRMFEGMAWIEKESLGIIRTFGRAVPPVYKDGKENLFPRFTTIRSRVDGVHWFPELTVGDDVLPFKTGPLRMRLEIRYTGYKRFASESTIQFEPPAGKEQIR